MHSKSLLLLLWLELSEYAIYLRFSCATRPEYRRLQQLNRILLAIVSPERERFRAALCSNVVCRVLLQKKRTQKIR